MKWHRRAASAAVFLGLAGCGPEALLAPGSVGQLPVAANPPELARLQKPEAHVPGPGDAGPPPKVEGELVGRICAIVNGRPILDAELREATLQLLRETERFPEPKRSALQKEVLKKGLDQLIDREIILSEMEERLVKRAQAKKKLEEYADKEFEKELRSICQRSGAASEDELTKIMAAQGLTLESFRRQKMRNFMVGEYMKSRIYPEIEKIGHHEIRQYYDEHPGEFQNDDRVKWQDIFIDAAAPQFPNRQAARRHADELAAKARHGADFAELSMKYDQGDSGPYRKGEGMGQRLGEIKPPEVESALFKMKPGEVGPIIELATGFHVIRLAERQYAGAQPFDDKTQSDIRKKLQNLIADREYQRILRDLRRKAAIQILLTDD